MPLAFDEAQELGVGVGVFAESSDHLAGDHGHAALVYSARGHALMGGIDHHTHPARSEYLIDAACDLRGELFLHLEASCITVHDACQLADADDLVGGQVADVRPTDDGC